MFEFLDEFFDMDMNGTLDNMEQASKFAFLDEELEEEEDDDLW